MERLETVGWHFDGPIEVLESLQTLLRPGWPLLGCRLPDLPLLDWPLLDRAPLD